jgi:hypothetical protein
VLGGDGCNGDPGTAAAPLDACYHAGRATVDGGDRASLYPAAAAHECLFFGGYIAGHRRFEEAIHLGLPNGNAAVWSWLSEPMYAGAFYQAGAHWSGTGTSSWYWNNQITATANLAGAAAQHTFRCSFDDRIR